MNPSPAPAPTGVSLRLTRVISAVGLALTASLVTLADGRSEAGLSTSDFLWDYYVAGRLLLTGQSKTIYALGSPKPWPPAFSSAAHAILPGLPAHLTLPFVYPPAMPCLMAPFSLLSPRVALFSFQALSIAALCASAWCVASLPGVRRGAVEVFLSAFALLFVGELLIMGQAGLVVGLLPLAVGYTLWQRDRPLAAGLVWSVLTLKVQLAIPPLLIIGALGAARLRSGRAALREPLLIALGFGLGGVAFGLLPIPFMGIESYRDWLADLHQFNLNLADPHGINYAPHLIGSLPEILATSGGDAGRAVGWAVSIGAAIASGLGLIAIARGSAERAVQRDTMMAVAVVAILFVAPYLRVYDSCVLILPGWIALHKLPEGSTARKVGLAVAVSLLLILDLDFVKIWFSFAET